MGQLICAWCHNIIDEEKDSECSQCGKNAPLTNTFQNSEDTLLKKVPELISKRKEAGLEGLVKGLDAIIINTEENHFNPAVKELLNTTGYLLADAFKNETGNYFILQCQDSANIIVQALTPHHQEFVPFNNSPKSNTLPNTRLQTYIFKTTNLNKYVEIQKKAGIQFLSETPFTTRNYSFIQTKPSVYTGNSIGFIEWNSDQGNYRQDNATDLRHTVEKPDKPYLKNIKYLDHTANRVRAVDRDNAITEFMWLTNYNFKFAIYVKDFNSITNVSRLSDKDFAMVFTSGIAPFKDLASSGPTEKFIYNYGTRAHHMAFHTENIEDTFVQLKEDGLGFLLELVGSPDEGLKQTFSEQSPHTFLVNEYIHRFGDFDGFFTKSNVTALTGATDQQ